MKCAIHCVSHSISQAHSMHVPYSNQLQFPGFTLDMKIIQLKKLLLRMRTQNLLSLYRFCSLTSVFNVSKAFLLSNYSYLLVGFFGLFYGYLPQALSATECMLLYIDCRTGYMVKWTAATSEMHNKQTFSNYSFCLTCLSIACIYG